MYESDKKRIHIVCEIINRAGNFKEGAYVTSLQHLLRIAGTTLDMKYVKNNKKF